MSDVYYEGPFFDDEPLRKKQYKAIFYGLLVYIVFEYIRFGIWIPALEPLHLQRTIAIITLIAFFASYKLPIKHPLPLLFFLFIIVLSTILNIGDLSRARALFFFIALIKITAVTYLISNILLTQYHLRKFIVVYLLCNLVLIVGSVIAGGSQGDLSHGVFAEGFISDSNDFSLAVNVVIPFFWYIFLYEEKVKMKVFWGTAFLLSMLATVYAYSRGGFLGLISTLLYIVSTSKNKIRNIILLSALLLTSSFFIPSSYWDKMATITEYESAGTRDSSQLRLNLWKIGIKMTADNPILGVGPMNFPYQIGKYGKDIVSNESDLSYLEGRVAHNTFINISAEMGIAGLICFMSLIVITYICASQSIKQYEQAGAKNNTWIIALPYALKASLIAYCVTSFFVTSYLYPHIYLLYALSIAVRQNTDEIVT